MSTHRTGYSETINNCAEAIRAYAELAMDDSAAKQALIQTAHALHTVALALDDFDDDLSPVRYEQTLRADR